jgi:YVTN family beta-propeller protein
MTRFSLPIALVLVLVSLGTADDQDRLKVGLQPDGRIVVPTNQILQPAGVQVAFPGRPVDLLVLEDGKTLVAKNMRNLVFIDVATGAIKQTLALPAAAKGLSAAFSAVGLVAVGDRVFATDSQGAIRVAKRNDNDSFAWEKAFLLNAPEVGGVAYPTGIARQGDSHLWVCANRGNELQLLHATTGEVEVRVPVGVAPYMPVVVGEKVYVSNWGGDPIGKDDTPLKSSGTPVRIDPRTNVANHGSVSVVAKTVAGWKQTKSITVGGHPSGMTASRAGRFLYVANANSDTVSVIDTAKDEVVETVDCKPEAKLPFGTGTNAVALSPDGLFLYVANGTGNCAAVISVGSSVGGLPSPGQLRPSRVEGFIPTGWYPGGERERARRTLAAQGRSEGEEGRQERR